MNSDDTMWKYYLKLPYNCGNCKINFFAIKGVWNRNLILLNSLKIFFKFLQHSFPEIFLKFNTFFRKFFQKFSQDLDKILLENCLIFVTVYPKFLENFLFLVEFPDIIFPLIFYHISTFSLSVNKVLKNFFKNL